ncbi:MAG: radical SAM protein [Candidatus Riflebacteria bacterium]|nr:radical SAM protein [Candidatus Riflebacteria bacterium]
MNNTDVLLKKLKLSRIEDCFLFPVYFEIETVNACNASCRMCTVKKWHKSSSAYMSPELFQKISDELIEYKDIVRVVNMSRDGEPLLDDKLEERIAYLKKCGIKHVIFSTNASLLNNERGLSLLQCGLDEIMFSVDGLKKDTFEKIRKGLNFEEVVGNIFQFIKLRDKLLSKLIIRVRMVIQEDNISEVEEWGKFWRSFLQKQDCVHAKSVHSWGNQLDNYVSVRDFQKIESPCTSPFSTMVIRYNGDVTICPVDFDFKYVNGNINFHSIKDIWQKGIYFKNFRQTHLKGLRDKFDFCKGCRLWDSEESKICF